MTEIEIELGRAKRLRQLLFILLLVLTLEGVARKAIPPLSTPIFLIKDVLVFIMGFLVFRLPRVPAIAFLWNAYRLLAILFIPLVLVTAWHDPVLAVFGAKQYLLYPIVALSVFHAFKNQPMEDIVQFFYWMALLILPTTILALIQLRLPGNHWLNMSVTGTSLEGFSAGGRLRVSSTFSFVAQYGAFLNAEGFILMIALRDWGRKGLIGKALLGCLIPLLIAGSFVTGSRGAVVGNLVLIVLAFFFILLKLQVRNIFQVLFVVLVFYGAMLMVKFYFPSTLEAYNARENGKMLGISAEIRGRVYDSFFTLGDDRSKQTLFGNGLGVMSNGSDTISSYAAYWRDYLSAWTETDFSSSLFEGGYYLVIIWYWFRIYVMAITTYRFITGVDVNFAVPVAFAQAFVVVVGTLGTLGIQPPVAIWWWFGVGTSLLFWWKCVSPPEEQLPPAPPPEVPQRLPRGRSMYADVLHPKKQSQ